MTRAELDRHRAASWGSKILARLKDLGEIRTRAATLQQLIEQNPLDASTGANILLRAIVEIDRVCSWAIEIGIDHLSDCRRMDFMSDGARYARERFWSLVRLARVAAVRFDFEARAWQARARRKWRTDGSARAQVNGPTTPFTYVPPRRPPIYAVETALEKMIRQTHLDRQALKRLASHRGRGRRIAIDLARRARELLDLENAIIADGCEWVADCNEHFSGSPYQRAQLAQFLERLERSLTLGSALSAEYHRWKLEFGGGL